MIDPGTAALEELAPLVARAGKRDLGPAECLRMVDLVQRVPGYIKRVAHALSAQRSAAGVEALRRMPPGVPGVVEGLYHAFAHGVARIRVDGTHAPPTLAIDFKPSRARGFDEIVERARAVFGDGFETFRVGGAIMHRFGLLGARGTLAGRAAAIAHDMQWLHGKLSRWKGTRLWLNGWPFPCTTSPTPPGGPLSHAVQVHLVRAWLQWAATQTHTRA
jgi:hypothetical protein